MYYTTVCFAFILHLWEPLSPNRSYGKTVRKAFPMLQLRLMALQMLLTTYIKSLLSALQLFPLANGKIIAIKLHQDCYETQMHSCGVWAICYGFTGREWWLKYGSLYIHKNREVRTGWINQRWLCTLCSIQRGNSVCNSANRFILQHTKDCCNIQLFRTVSVTNAGSRAWRDHSVVPEL